MAYGDSCGSDITGVTGENVRFGSVETTVLDVDWTSGDIVGLEDICDGNTMVTIILLPW